MNDNDRYYKHDELTIERGVGCDNMYFEFTGCEPPTGPSTNFFYCLSEFNKIEFTSVVERTENAAGESIATHKRLERIHSFNVLINNWWLNKLYSEFSQTNVAELQLLNTSFQIIESIECYDIELEELDPSDFNDLHLVKVSFKNKADTIESSTACCGTTFENGPIEDPCDGTVDPPDGEDCDLVIQINRFDDTLEVSASGVSTWTTQWRFRENNSSQWIILGTGSSISLGQYGQYQAVVTGGGCTRRDIYTYQNPCQNRTITLTKTLTTISANISDICNDAEYEWHKWIDDEWEVISGANTPNYVPDSTGVYQFKMSCGDCDYYASIDFIYHDEESCPDAELEVVKDGDVLFADPSNQFNIDTVQWWIDRGDGNRLVQLPNNTQQQSIVGSGMYKAIITTEDECEYDNYIVIIDCGEECGLIVSIVANVADGIGTLSILSNEDLENADIRWHRNTGTGWTPFASGMQLIDINSAGLYRVTVTIGDCVAQSYYLNMICEESECGYLTAEIQEGGGILRVVHNCASVIKYIWSIEDENGVERLSNNTDAIIPTRQGLYRVQVYCSDDCMVEAVFIVYECDDCLEVFIPGEPNPITLCN